VYRALGARVGRRVYWPGVNLSGLCECDLLEVRALLSTLFLLAYQMPGDTF